MHISYNAYAYDMRYVLTLQHNAATANESPRLATIKLSTVFIGMLILKMIQESSLLLPSTTRFSYLSLTLVCIKLV